MFEHDGVPFMIPETSEARQLRLYRCHRFPLEWRLETVLMDDVVAVDSMVFPAQGRWWMLTCLDTGEPGALGNELHVFSASRPDCADWTTHARNPVLTSAAGGRNGGLLHDGDALFRVGQIHGFQSYGAGFSINRIEKLDAREYGERTLASVRPDFRPDIGGAHHMDARAGMTMFDSRRWRCAG
jgi:hypothetical protein